MIDVTKVEWTRDGELIPGGAQTLSKMRDRFPGAYPRSLFSGRGAKVRDNAVAAFSALFKRLGKQPTNDLFRLHKEDPETGNILLVCNRFKDQGPGDTQDEGAWS